MSLVLPSLLRPLCAAPVAVFGGGVSGRALSDLLRAVGAEVVLYDERGGEGQRAEFDAACAAVHRLVVFSPGFRVGHPWLAQAAAAGCVCLGELDFASLFWKGRTLSVTGTNGKTTLTEFLTHALRCCGEQAFATGNIGHSFSRLVLERQGGEAEDWAVCEVSSFQAEVLWHFRTEGVLWTNFAEDHLERHEGLRAYFAAKFELVERCDGGRVCVGTSTAAYASVLGFELPLQATLVNPGLGDDPGLLGTVFERQPQRENYELAAAWWLLAGRELSSLREAARSFRLGRHRLALVCEHRGVQWWNDSKATNFHAVEAALAASPSPVVLIAGGKAKGGDIAGFVARIAARVRLVLLVGETRGELARACASLGLAHRVCGDFEGALLAAEAEARPGERVLLSPGFASFDMFRGYDHRGEVFESWIRSRASANPSS